MKKILFAFLLTAFYFAGNAQTLQEGIKHLENENYTQALNTFNAICKADPKNASVYYYIGEVHYQLEDYAEAEKAYRKGIATNAQCAECNIGLGKLELDKGNTSKADEYFQIAIRANKKNSYTYGLIGDAYLYSKKPVAMKAVEYLSTARDMNTQEARFWAHLGDAYALSGNHGEAMTAYERAVEKNPANTEAYISMARIWARAKQAELAIPKLEEAIRLSPNDARPYKDLYELYIQERRYEKVVPLLEKYVSLIGTDIDAKVRLVKFLTFQAKDYDRAITEGEKLLVTNPDQYTLHRWLTWAYAGKAKQLEADQATDTTITNAVILANYQKAYDHSVALFEAIEKDNSRKAFTEDYDYWALAALKLGKVDEAAHVYRKYIEFDTSKAGDIYATLAKTYYDSANYEQAIAYYNRAGEIQHLTAAQQNYLALSYFRTKDYIKSDSAFVRVIELSPTYVYAYFMRAAIASQQDPERKDFLALPHYEKLIEVASADPVANKKYLIEAYEYMAYHASQIEDFEKAKQYYELVLSLDPGHAIALDNLKHLNER